MFHVFGFNVQRYMVSESRVWPSVTRVFRGRSMEGVMVIKEEDIGMYKRAKRQKNAVSMKTRMTDDIELRENQAENLYTKAFKTLLASSSDASQDFVLCGLNDSSGSGTPTLVIKKALTEASGADEDLAKPKTTSAISIRDEAPEEADQDTTDQDMMSNLLLAFGGQPASAGVKAKAKPKPKAKSTAAASAGANASSTPANRGVSAVSPAASMGPPSASDQARHRPVLGEINKNVGNGAPKRSLDADCKPHNWELPDLPTFKRGRVSASNLQDADDRFGEEMEKLITTICEAGLPEKSDGDLVQYVKDASSKTREIIAKCTTKITQMKRRKHSDDDRQMDRLKEVNNAANLFSRLCTELGSAAPKAGELSHVITQLGAPPLNFRISAVQSNRFPFPLFFFSEFCLSSYRSGEPSF